MQLQDTHVDGLKRNKTTKPPSNATIHVFVPLGFCCYFYMYLYGCVYVKMCVPRGQLVGSCSLVCGNQRLIHEHWFLLTI